MRVLSFAILCITILCAACQADQQFASPSQHDAVAIAYQVDETNVFGSSEPIGSGVLFVDEETAGVMPDSIAQFIAFAKASSPKLNPDRIDLADLKIDWLKFYPGSREKGHGLEKPLVELDSLAYFNLVNPNDSASAFYLDPCFVSESCDGVKWRWEKNK